MWTIPYIRANIKYITIDKYKSVLDTWRYQTPYGKQRTEYDYAHSPIIHEDWLGNKHTVLKILKSPLQTEKVFVTQESSGVHSA